MLTAADDALQSAAEPRDQTSKEVDKKFKKAIDLLSTFELEKDLSFKDPTSDPDIGGAVTRFASTILSALKKNLHAKVKPSSYSFTSLR